MNTPVFENVMDNAQAESIRKIVLCTLSGWGVSDAGLDALRVSDVSRGGIAIGRRFETEGYRAMWLWDRDVIVFWGAASQLLKTVSVSDALGGVKVA